MGAFLLGCFLAALQNPDLTSLLQELRSDDPARRNAATAQLEKCGADSLPTLTAALDASRDPEVRSRLEKIIGEVEVGAVRPRRLVFTRGEDSEGELYLWEKGEVSRLTKNHLIEARPQLSPDGARLLYFSMASTEDWKTADVVVMNLADRSTVRVGSGYDPAWSPDGSRIAYLTTTEIHVVAPDGTGDTPFNTQPGTLRNVVWSHDGKEVAIEVADGIAIVPVLGGRQRRILSPTDQTPTLYNWSWSPDGKTFSMVAGSGPYLWNVYTVGADGKGLAARTEKGWVGHGIVQWSPDSRRVAVCVRLGSGLGPPEPENGGLDSGLHILDSTNGVIRRVATDVDPILLPQWSPDGKFILHVSSKLEIRIVHVGTGAARKVTEMGIPYGAGAMWFPPTVQWSGK